MWCTAALVVIVVMLTKFAAQISSFFAVDSF